MQAQGLHFGPRVGMNMATFVEKDHDYYNENKTTNIGFQVGATAELEILSFLYVSSTVSFYQAGSKMKDDFGSSRITLNNLKVPVEVGYKLPIGNVSVFGSIGPYMSVSMFGKYKFIPDPDNEFMEEGYDYEVEFGDDPSWISYKRLDTGLSIGAGVDYKQYQARLNYSSGLRDLSNDEGTFSTYYKTTSSILNISVAYFIGRTE
jgi:hypothetical protein